MMQTLLKSRWLLFMGLIVVAIGLWFTPSSVLKPLDKLSDHYFEEAITSASLAYATTRAVNATVSVVQHSELQMEPGGVGVSIAAGQILDPVNDMAERLSDVLVVAIVSLGIQKIAFELAQMFTLKVLSVTVLLLSVSVLLNQLSKLQGYFRNILVLLLLARLMMPACALLSGGFDQYFVQPEISQASQTLKVFDSKVEQLQTPQHDGMLAKAKALAAYTSQFSEQLKQLLRYVDTAVTALLTITWWYVAAFILQAILLPVLSGLVLWHVWKSLSYSRHY